MRGDEFFALRKLVLPVMAACLLGACTVQKSGLVSSDSMLGLFEDRFNQNVSLQEGPYGCAALVSEDRNGDWRVCGVGQDFVRFCPLDGGAPLTYPAGRLCFSGE
jgi:hypothetical protein